jgi:hypothetical protein
VPGKQSGSCVLRHVPQDISTREIAVLDALLKLHDAFGTIYQDQALASLFPRSGQAVDTQWQAHCPSGIDAGQCVLNREHQRATCPQGKTSRSLGAPQPKTASRPDQEPVFHH